MVRPQLLLQDVKKAPRPGLRWRNNRGEVGCRRPRIVNELEISAGPASQEHVRSGVSTQLAKQPPQPDNRSAVGKHVIQTTDGWNVAGIENKDTALYLFVTHLEDTGTVEDQRNGRADRER